MVFNFAVMTWNIENLFPPGHSDGPKTQAIYDAKMVYLADKILAIAPEVVAFQEVGDPASFAELQTHLRNLFPHAALGRPDGRGIRVGILSRLPFQQVAHVDTFPAGSLTKIDPDPGSVIKAMGRGALHVEVRWGTSKIHVVALHLKSKLISYPSTGSGPRFSPRDENERARETAIALIKRTGEATAVRVYLNNLLTGNDDSAILMGDLNDETDALTTQILLGPFDGSLKRQDKGDDVRLYNLAADLPPGRNFSRIYKKSYELIDHIMVSHDLMFVPRQVDAFTADINPIDESRANRRDEFVPDHAPLYARFELPSGGVRFLGG